MSSLLSRCVRICTSPAGAIPLALGNLTALQSLRLGSNQLGGEALGSTGGLPLFTDNEHDCRLVLIGLFCGFCRIFWLPRHDFSRRTIALSRPPSMQSPMPQAEHTWNFVAVAIERGEVGILLLSGAFGIDPALRVCVPKGFRRLTARSRGVLILTVCGSLSGTVPLSVWRLPCAKTIDLSGNLLTRFTGEKTQDLSIMERGRVNSLVQLLLCKAHPNKEVWLSEAFDVSTVTVWWGFRRLNLPPILV